MNYSKRIIALENLKSVKEEEFEEAFSKFSSKGQKVITFSELNILKEEIIQIAVLITALKNFR